MTNCESYHVVGGGRRDLRDRLGEVFAKRHSKVRVMDGGLAAFSVTVVCRRIMRIMILSRRET